MGFRFEFDPVNKILLALSEGRLTDESLGELYVAIRKYSTTTDARAGIWDLSSITEFAVTSDFVRKLAEKEPAMPDARRLRLQASRPTTAEAVATALSPHPITPAQLFQLPPSRPQLAAPAPHLLQGRTYRYRNQPAL